LKTLKIEEIPENGLQLDEKLGIDFLNELLPNSQEFAPKAPGVAKLFLQKQSGNVLIRGQAHAEVSCVCASCLKEISLELKPKIDLILFRSEADKSQKEDDEIELTGFDDEGPGEADGAGTFDGKIIDWGSQVRESLVLALPLAPRCKDDCKGLCPVCGIDKNEAECQCVVKQMDPRWEKLKTLKLPGN
jgi:uncharacterized protein